MEQKELFRIDKKNNVYILYVYNKEYLKSENLDLLTAEIFRICIL